MQILVIEDVIIGSTLEYLLGTKLQSLFPNTTVLVFTNGVNALKTCNRIAFIEKGKVQIYRMMLFIIYLILT